MAIIPGPLPEDVIRTVLARVEKMLREDVVAIDDEIGVKYHEDFRSGLMIATPANRRTLTIRVNGGAIEESETFDEQIARRRAEQIR